MRRVALRVGYDELHECVVLCLGEAEVCRWPVTTGYRDTDLGAQWRLERFVAEKLGRLIETGERAADEVMS